MTGERSMTPTTKEAVNPADLDQHLWAVSVSGPDDLVPVASYEHACRAANFFNAWWLSHVTAQGGLHKYDPHMWASPIIYRGTAESHAEGVAHPSSDYVAFMDGAAT